MPEMAEVPTLGRRLRDTLQLKGTGEIPVLLWMPMATWLHYGDALLDVMERHPRVPGPRPARGTDFRRLIGPACREGEEYLDNWGCLWKCASDGMEGQIAAHPLADLRHLRHYRAPDPLVYGERELCDWGAFARRCHEARAKYGFVRIDGERFFERVHFLRGMEDIMADMAAGAPEVDEIVELVLDYNLRYVEQALTLGAPVDLVCFGDDWGCQDRCMIGPEMFRRYFKPGYARMYALCRQYGALTMQHSDGYTVDLWDDFLEAGLTAFNMQTNCMGVKVVEERLKGRMGIIADIDRQQVLPFGTPAEVREHISELVGRLGSPRGGLVLSIDINPDVPLSNVEALFVALEEYDICPITPRIMRS
jgi:uroporphyrinogen decarboxylase